ncbi:MAG: TauD/TfdA family dioxygenase [Dyella sp.]|uniref:TauD/TfdA family dioxygenase n=1 Tax=Dyella sp. TaxID=1869338 RepID=UPI003F7FC1E1
MTVSTDDELSEIAGHAMLLNVEPGQRPMAWAAQNSEMVGRVLHEQGALLIRGLRLYSTRQFGQFLEAVFHGELAAYSYRSTPRTKLGGNVYTATEYHPSETIPQHNESSYASTWPMRIGFYCMVPPAPGVGGATPLADSRLVLARLPAHVVEKFESRKLQYVRNYGSIDLPWSEVFQTEDRHEVEAFCDSNGIAYEWTADNGLRTRQVTPALATHPYTGEKVWFNQAHLFHVSALPKEVLGDLLATYSEEELPRNVYHGDGGPLDGEDLQAIRAAYESVTFHFDWQREDILLLDNMLYTHGRQPYAGERKIVVGMAGMHGHASRI